MCVSTLEILTLSFVSLNFMIFKMYDSFVVFILSASANRKTFKTSVKPGWYYFGRKMVRQR